MSPRVFSAPGKALVAGGYLVLDKQFNSYAVALSARMHAVVDGETSSSNTTLVTVKSPQFAEGEWVYTSDGSTVTETRGRVNPFAAAAVATVLAYIDPAEHYNVTITVFSDSGYHSQDESTLKTSSKKSFHYHTQKITDVAKTGLGSSAGLVTVLTTALLSFFKPDLDIDNDKHLKIVHNLAQIAHCQAQGKVGSGFDVAAAVFGSIVYRRFDPKLINDLNHECSSGEYHDQIVALANSDWEFKHERVALPRGVKLLMGDVKGGSNTPKLVSKVLAWRKEDPESAQVYAELDRANNTLVHSLAQLNELATRDPKTYDTALSFIRHNTSSTILASTDSALMLFQQLIGAVSTIRHNLRVITTRSGAEIEPPQQTTLLDACQELPGVIAGVVPGAGGYDAVSLIIAEDATGEIYEKTKKEAQFEKVTWMDLREEALGVRQEKLDDYREFLG